MESDAECIKVKQLLFGNFNKGGKACHYRYQHLKSLTLKVIDIFIRYVLENNIAKKIFCIQ